jgi:hypothetical protein
MTAKRLFVIGVVLIFSQCFLWEASGESSQSQGTADELRANELRARAKEYWRYRIDRDYEKSYGFENPEKIKGVNLTKYIGTFGSGVKWLGSEVDQVNINGDTGYVLMKIRYSMDCWKLVNGTWYHQFRNIQGVKPKPRTRTAGPAKEQTNGKEENKQQRERQEAR